MVEVGADNLVKFLGLLKEGRLMPAKYDKRGDSITLLTLA